MIKLDKAQYAAAFDQYRTGKAFFPLIGAVLADAQDGVVYADDAATPSQVYVEHAFGFAQVFGRLDAAFEAGLQAYLLADKSFSAPKVRLYTPGLPIFLRQPQFEPLRSLRQRFVIEDAGAFDARFKVLAADGALTLAAVDRGNVAEIESAFSVICRFWRSQADFIGQANAVVALYHGRPAAICYAAAVADDRAEIDVLTLADYRNRGTGKFAVMHFVKRCFACSLQPLWDCFANNEGSLQLCRSVGFTARGAPYPFFTLNR